MINVKRNKEKQYCLHCLETANTFTFSVKKSTGMQFVLCEKCAEKLLVEISKALNSTNSL